MADDDERMVFTCKTSHRHASEKKRIKANFHKTEQLKLHTELINLEIE